jgi:hypothetical protein
MSFFVARLRDPTRPTLCGTCVISTSPHFVTVGATIGAGCDFVYTPMPITRPADL